MRSAGFAGAPAGLALYREHRADRPVAAVIYTYSHIDHFGGVLGVVDAGTAVPIVAPEHFLDHVISENVYAGVAMLRRGLYHTGASLPVSATGLVGVGLGSGTSIGTVGRSGASPIPPQPIREDTAARARLIMSATCPGGTAAAWRPSTSAVPMPVSVT